MKKLAYKLVEEVVNFKPTKTIRVVLKDPKGGFLAETPSKIFQNKRVTTHPITETCLQTPFE